MTSRPDRIATYRVQLRPECRFTDVAEAAPYLASLGVSHVYLSPMFEAAPGSTHGYDVVDPTCISDVLGGDDGFRALVLALREHGLAVMADIVPNHMATAVPANRWWTALLAEGPASPTAHWFDVDWDGPDASGRGRILAPVLGRRYGDALEAGEVRLVRTDRLPAEPLASASAADGRARLGAVAVVVGGGDGPILPLSAEALAAVLGGSPGDGPDAAPLDPDELDAALERVAADPDRLDAALVLQHYRLAWWRTASTQVDFRRFFDVDSLVGLRIELPEVFTFATGTIVDLVDEGLVDGIRIDHPDGLRAPGEFLTRLRRAIPEAWIVVEKILHAPVEELPASWPVDGTTGYDFTALVSAWLVAPGGREPLLRTAAAVTGVATSFSDTVDVATSEVLDDSLRADVLRLARSLHLLAAARRPTRDVTRDECELVIREMLVRLSVYRTYSESGAPARPADRQAIDRAAELATDGLDGQELTALVGLLRDVLVESLDDLGPSADGPVVGVEVAREVALDLRLRLQQMMAPAMAKGQEDRALYRSIGCLALNEVGVVPDSEPLDAPALHAALVARTQPWAGTLNALTTHDTKRSEDVRARLSVLADDPAWWDSTVHRWNELTADHHVGSGPDPVLQLLLFQTLLGAWPISPDRLHRYAEKAMRETALRTSWRAIDPEFESAVDAFLDAVLADPVFVDEVRTSVARVLVPGRVRSLTQKVLSILGPGVGDIYQGTELWDLRLVDPDNRDPVDFGALAGLLDDATGLDDAALLDSLVDPSDVGLAKLRVVTRCLHLRAGIDPAAPSELVSVSGDPDGDVLAFVRGDVTVVIDRHAVRHLPPDLRRDAIGASGGASGSDAAVLLPAGTWRHGLVDETPPVVGEVAVGDLLRSFPVAALTRAAP